MEELPGAVGAGILGLLIGHEDFRDCWVEEVAEGGKGDNLETSCIGHPGWKMLDSEREARRRQRTGGFASAEGMGWGMGWGGAFAGAESAQNQPIAIEIYQVIPQYLCR